MNTIEKIKTYILRKIRVMQKKTILKKELSLVKNKNFVIITDDCWGGEIYKWFDRPFNTPFIGLYIHGECYIELLSNFDYYMGLELVFKAKSNSKYPDTHNEPDYPLGFLDKIEIHFMHYESAEEAKSKWDRRTLRMFQEKNRDNYFFKICDREGATQVDFEKFHQLKYKNKISFIQKENKKLNYPNHLGVLQKEKGEKIRVPNGVKLFKITFLYFNLVKWLSTSIVERTHYKT